MGRTWSSSRRPRYYRSRGARLTLNVTACPDAPCTQGSALLAIPAYSYVNYIFIASANLCGTEPANNFIGGSSVVGSDRGGRGVADDWDPLWSHGVPGANVCKARTEGGDY